MGKKQKQAELDKSLVNKSILFLQRLREKLVV